MSGVSTSGFTLNVASAAATVVTAASATYTPGGTQAVESSTHNNDAAQIVFTGLTAGVLYSLTVTTATLTGVSNAPTTPNWQTTGSFCTSEIATSQKLKHCFQLLYVVFFQHYQNGLNCWVSVQTSIYKNVRQRRDSSPRPPSRNPVASVIVPINLCFDYFEILELYKWFNMYNGVFAFL